MQEFQNNGTVIQTEDLFLRKEADAVSVIGNHLLIVGLYKNGAVIGNRFDSRQNEERQWIKKINSTSLIIGLGQSGCFNSFCRYADSLKSSITDNLLPERYMTLRAYDIFLTPIFRSNYESGRPLGLDIIYADIKKSKLKIVRFTGDTSVFSGFGILGGYPFPVQTEPLVVKFPVKEAVKKMESIFGEKKCLETMEAAMDAVMKTLFEFDPITKKETYEFTVFEGGVLNSTYIERIQQKNNEK